MLTKEDIQIIAELIHNEVAPLDQRMGNLESDMADMKADMRTLTERQAALEEKTDRIMKVTWDVFKASTETLERCQKLLDKMDRDRDLLIGSHAAQDVKILEHENRITALEAKVG